MANIEVAKMSLLTAPSKGIGHIADKAPAMEIWYDGSPIAGVATTSATVQYTTDTLFFKINGSIDTRLGDGAEVDCNNASYNTAILVERHINSIDGWHCRLLGVLGASSSDAVYEDSAAALNCLRTAAVINIDTSAHLTHSFCITNATAPVNVPSGLQGTMKREAIYDERGAMNCLFYLSYIVTLGGTSTCNFYSINRVTETENLLGTILPAASNLVNTFDFKGIPLTAQPGEQLVVIHTDNTSLTSTSSIINAKSIRT
jgi:hypothetical protein